MTSVRDTFNEASQYAVGLLADPAVAKRWNYSSALEDMTVAALAGHLARQIFSIERLLASSDQFGEPITVLEHYDRVPWREAGLQDEPNVSIRQDSAEEAADGPAALAERAATAAAELYGRLAAEPADRVVPVTWAGWSLTLDDLLRTRILEIAVHGDDLAYSVGQPAAEPPQAVASDAVNLLAQIALGRHGAAAMLRALSRAERAPASITAF